VEGGGNGCGRLLVDRDGLVHGLHRGERQLRGHRIHDLREVGAAGSCEILRDDRCDVLEAEDVLRVRQHRVLLALELGIGREDVTGGDLLLVEQRVDADAPERHELRLLQPVDVLQPEEAGDARAALRVAGERERLDLLHVADRLDPVLLRRRRQHPEGVGVVERRPVQQCGVTARLLELLGRRVDPGGSLGCLLVGDVGDDDAGVFRIEVDLAALEGGVDQLRAADALVIVDGVALRLERLLVELAEDELLGEVLAADRDGRLRGGRCTRPEAGH
jgi:hypothetical protein